MKMVNIVLNHSFFYKAKFYIDFKNMTNNMYVLCKL